MNLNVKVEGDEEQTLQYVNRFAINIPSGATAFNLNIVNPCLSNQSYILNPVNSVGQNIVTYQPSMALQPYITLPAESEGNVLHSLPVGVPVPVGLPVPAGLLQNHNFVNTSIIIGNEDCNTPGVLKSPQNSLNSSGELKISYIQKPEEELINSGNVTTVEVQSLELNCSPHISSEDIIKQSCQFDTSLKEANADLEFEKCASDVVLIENGTVDLEKIQFITEKLPFEGQFKSEQIKVPLQISTIQKPTGVEVHDKKIKTEITWENNNIKEKVIGNDFQESLICEVEEVNDDEYEDEEQVEGEIEEGKLCLNTGNNQNDKESTSSEDDDTLPLSVALRLKKLPNSKNNKKTFESKIIKKGKKENSSGNVLPHHDTAKRKRSQRTRKQTEMPDCEMEWSESDDDVLDLKHAKNEPGYRGSSEPKTAPSKPEDKLKKFVRVRSCCSKKECAKKISVKDQKAVHQMFYELESNDKRDAYLVNCIEHVSKNRSVDDTKDKKHDGYKPENKNLLVNENIQLEIENESNGNQKLSDEIQNAINESLKDCIAASEIENKAEEESADEDKEKGEKNNWNFYVVIDRCRKKVCLQFLLKLFRVTKSRIKQLQKKILSGLPLTDETNSGKSDSSRVAEIWKIAKSHLDTLPGEECIDCTSNPRHRFLTDSCTREYLFSIFKEFYCGQIGKDPNIKYASYKKFLDKETNLSFVPKKDGVCTECEHLRRQQKRKLNKSLKGSSSEKSSSSENPQRKKKWQAKANLEQCTSDDEPLLKREKLKLTISLKATNNTTKTQQKRNWKNNSADKRSRIKLNKEKSRQSMNKGRDVWSLMLLHLETMPYKECNSCTNKKKHRFLDTTFTTQGLFEDYRRYFLKETNSELGLGFTMYEKYFNRNCNYMICDLNEDSPVCPRCAIQNS